MRDDNTKKLAEAYVNALNTVKMVTFKRACLCELRAYEDNARKECDNATRHRTKADTPEAKYETTRLNLYFAELRAIRARAEALTEARKEDESAYLLAETEARAVIRDTSALFGNNYGHIIADRVTSILYRQLHSDFPND